MRKAIVLTVLMWQGRVTDCLNNMLSFKKKRGKEEGRREGEEIAHFHFVDDTILCLDVYFELLRVSM